VQLRCSVCRRFKEPEDFAWHRKAKDQRDTYCRACRAAYKRAHYAANRQRYIDNAARRKRRLNEENLRQVLRHLSAHPCADCGETDPLVLEFDHVGDKSFSIGSALRDRPWGQIEHEISQCEVVCANCHRRRTARRGGFMRAALVEVRRALPSPPEDDADTLVSRSRE
jgi:hypothetical protein